MSWEMVKLADCLQLITYGFTNPMPDSEEGPWKVTAKDIVDGRIDFTTARHTTVAAFENDLTDKSRPIRDDLLLTKDGTLGRLAIVGDETICINQSVALLRLKKEFLLPRYLLYLLQSPEYQGKMLADAGGSTIKHIYITKVNQLMIPVPPLEVQQKLIDILSAYDRMIDNCKEQIKLLEEAAQRLYKEWFLDLRFPGHETTPIIDGLPEGWTVQSMNDIAEYINGYAFKPTDWGTEGKPIIKIKEMGSGVTADTPRNTGEDIPKKYNVTAGDILFSWSATLSAMIWDEEDGLLNQHLFKVIPGEGISREFVLQSILKTLDEFSNLTTGSTMKHIQRGKLKEVKVNVPSTELIEQYRNISEPIREQILNIKRQMILLREARDRLLPKLMNREIEV